MLWMNYDADWWMSWVRDENKLIRSWLLGPDADPTYWWDTNRKLFSLTELCALLSAILVVL